MSGKQDVVRGTKTKYWLLGSRVIPSQSMHGFMGASGLAIMPCRLSMDTENRGCRLLRTNSISASVTHFVTLFGDHLVEINMVGMQTHC